MANSENMPPTYYLDSGVFIDLISFPADQEPAKSIAALLQSAQDGKCRLVTSTVTIIEVLKACHEKTGNVFDDEVQSRIESLWHPGSSPVEVVEAHEMVVRESLKAFRDTFREYGWSKAKGLDIVHLVTARREGATKFFTTELHLKKYEAVFGFVISAPHLPPEPVKSKDDCSTPEKTGSVAGTLFEGTKNGEESADATSKPEDIDSAEIRPKPGDVKRVGDGLEENDETCVTEVEPNGEMGRTEELPASVDKEGADAESSNG